MLGNIVTVQHRVLGSEKLLMAKTKDAPKGLKAFIQHRVELDYSGTSDAVGTCPFCSGNRKFYANQESGLWDCKVCARKGNPSSFIRQLFEESNKKQIQQSVLEAIAEERRVDAESLIAWNFCRSIVDGEWMFPGYNLKKEVSNLYRWSSVQGGKRRLMGTAGLSPALFGLHLFDKSKKTTYITEGPWDGISCWEMLSRYKIKDGRVTRTVDKTVTMINGANVVSIPGCESFQESWLQLFTGQNVVIVFDSDYPKLNKSTGDKMMPGGYAGVLRTSKMLKPIAQSVCYLHWGDEGFDPSKADGFDLRDLLTTEE